MICLLATVFTRAEINRKYRLVCYLFYLWFHVVSESDDVYNLLGGNFCNCNVWNLLWLQYGKVYRHFLWTSVRNHWTFIVVLMFRDDNSTTNVLMRVYWSVFSNCTVLVRSNIFICAVVRLCTARYLVACCTVSYFILESLLLHMVGHHEDLDVSFKFE